MYFATSAASLVRRWRRRSRDRSGADPFANRRAFQLACPFGARQRRLRPDERTPNLLVSLEASVRISNDGVGIDTVIEHEHDVHPLTGGVWRRRSADGGRVAHTRDLVHDPLDIIREDLQAFRRHDHFLLASSNEQSPVRADLADVTGVEPATFEGPRRFRLGFEVARR